MAEANEAGTNTAEGGGTTDAGEAARIEARAGALGWVPKETYEQRGKDPSTWVDAATFVKRGREFNKNQTRTIQQLQNEVVQLRSTRQAFIELQTRENTALRKQLDEAERGARRAQEEARINGDVDSALAADDRIAAIREEKAAAITAAAKLEKEGKSLKAETEDNGTDLGDGRKAVPNPEYQAIMDEWVADGNQWFNTDPKLRRWAIDVGEGLKRDFPDIAPKEFLAKVREVMEADFPNKFAGTQRANKTTTGAPRGAGSGRTTADLPEEDRAIMKQLIAEGFYKTEQDFLNSYFSR